jgi:hypothetical protein
LGLLHHDVMDHWLLLLLLVAALLNCASMLGAGEELSEGGTESNKKRLGAVRRVGWLIGLKGVEQG